MSGHIIPWSLLLCVAVLWLGAPRVYGGPCADDAHEDCDPITNKTYSQVTSDELESICDEMLGHVLCFAGKKTNCGAFDDMDLDTYMAQLDYRCDNTADFLKHRACVDDAINSKPSCPNPQLYSKTDKKLDLDRDHINVTRHCWKNAVKDKCGAETAAWYDGYLDVTHEVIMDYYDNAVRMDSKCYKDATEQCFSPLRKDHSEIWMTKEELERHCKTEEATVSCFEDQLSGCGSYDKLLIEEEVERMKYVCNDTAEFRQHEECLIGLAFRDDINCTVLEVPHFGADITEEITEAEVNSTKMCWQAAVQKACPAMADWFEGYDNIRYELALKYSAGSVPLASIFTLLMALVLGKLMA